MNESQLARKCARKPRPRHTPSGGDRNIVSLLTFLLLCRVGRDQQTTSATQAAVNRITSAGISEAHPQSTLPLRHLGRDQRTASATHTATFAIQCSSWSHPNVTPHTPSPAEGGREENCGGQASLEQLAPKRLRIVCVNWNSTSYFVELQKGFLRRRRSFERKPP